jgi:hypothetical protein
MSTRATYEFPGEGIVIYKHHDGYPEGAAHHLYQAFLRRKRGLGAGFLRGNEDAEITGGHEDHGDTEFRYTVRAGSLSEDRRTIEVRCDSARWISGGFAKEWGRGPWRSLVDFFKEHEATLMEWLGDDYSPMVHVAGAYGVVGWMTAKEAEARIEELLRTLGLWTVKGPLSETHSNANSVREEIGRLRDALALPWTEADQPVGVSQ